MPELVKCFHCGSIAPVADMYERIAHPGYRQPFSESEMYHCEDCSSEIIRCDFCRSEFHSLQLTTGSNLSACPECMEGLIRCSECDELVIEDETEEFIDGRVCQSCAQDIRNNLTYLHPYNYKPDPIFHSMSKELCQPYYGWELEIDRTEEIDNWESKEDHAIEIHNQSNGSELSEYEKFAYIKKDGSLKHGMEIVSHPCTYAYHTQQMGLKYILKECDRLGYSSHDVGTCGLHIHISRSAFGTRPGEEEMNIAKLLLFFEINWNNIVKFSRRSQQSITDYCNRYGLKDGEKPHELLEKAKQSGRFFAVNLKNEKTVEIRIFRGTLKLETFTACLQFTHLITELVSSLKVQDILDLTWTELINVASEKGYSEFVAYSKSKNLK